MLILIFILSIILMFVFIGTDDYFGDEFAFGLGLLAIGCFIAILVASAQVMHGRIIDEEIILYEDQNKKIEEQLQNLVVQYMDYEKTTFGDLSSDSAVTLVSLYPDLKADTLVSKQCDVYVSNNQKIIELKEEKLNITVWRWWLYFGK